jgi:purine-nucleoside phosphorylase
MTGSSSFETAAIALPTAYLRERFTRAPRVVLVLGSGLGAVAEEVIDPLRLPYAEIPGFPDSTVAGHAGALVAGIWEGTEVVAMQGRFHLYEGWPSDAVVLPLRVLRALGADHVVVTNAAGGINPGLMPGSLMLIADHINLMFRNPLVGRTVPGEDRFPDMSAPYDPAMRDVAARTAAELGIPLTPGVYAAVLGPSFETPAEIRMLARMGADAVGMSTVPEVLAARALGMKVLGISCVTNAAAGLGATKLTHEEVLREGASASEYLVRLLRALLPRIVLPNLPTEAAP